MKFTDTYLDVWGRPQPLTATELTYFRETVSLVKEALDISIEITNRDHERDMPGKGREAYGIFYTQDPKNPSADCFITIDNYFIHECYEEKYHGALNLSFESLESVICHEVAHATKFRHCKSHTQLSQAYLRQVEDYCAQIQKKPLDEKIRSATDAVNASGDRTSIGRIRNTEGGMEL